MTDLNKNIQKTIGYLEKRGKLKFMNSWKKYWFVLEGHLLLYYGSKDDYDAISPCKGSITLGPSCSVKPYSSVPMGFQISTRSTTVTLRADSISEQTKWMQAILSSLHQNQNTNKSPTKLNHFRYSMERVDMIESNKEITQTSPQTMSVSPHWKLEHKDSNLLDRLQKLGARSYSDSPSFQNQILESARNSVYRHSSGKSREEDPRNSRLDGSEILKSKKAHVPLKNRISNVYQEITEKNDDKTIEEEQEVLLEDDDYCVCTLGKETDEEDFGEDHTEFKMPSKTRKVSNHHEHDQSLRTKSDSKDSEPNLEIPKKIENINHEHSSTYTVPKEAKELQKVQQCSRNISLLEHFYCDNEIYVESDGRPRQNEFVCNNDIYAEPNKTHECQLKIEKNKEPNKDFECENELYRSPKGVRTAPNRKSSRNENPVFHFPPAPTEEFQANNTYAEPENECGNDNIYTELETSKGEYQGFDIYTEPKSPKNEFQNNNKFIGPNSPGNKFVFNNNNNIYTEPEEILHTALKEVFQDNNIYTEPEEVSPVEPKEDFHGYSEPAISPVCNRSTLYKGPKEEVFIQQDEFDCDNELYATPKKEYETKEAEFQFENDLYADPRTQSEECDNEIYAEPNKRIEFQAKNDSCQADMDATIKFHTKNEELLDNELYSEPNKALSNLEIDTVSHHLYNHPFKQGPEAESSDESNVYEDPEKLLVKKKEETDPEMKKKANKEEKSTMKKKRRKSEHSKCSKLDDCKKHDSFIQRLLKQASWKHSDKSDKSEEMAHHDVGETLVMLTNIQELLEKKKGLIRAMAEKTPKPERRNRMNSESHPKAEGITSRSRSQSDPHEPPDPSRNLHEDPTFTSTFSMNLDDEYSLVHDKIPDDHEDIYSEIDEIVSGNHTKKLKDLIEEMLKHNKHGRPEKTDMECAIPFPVAVDSKEDPGETT